MNVAKCDDSVKIFKFPKHKNYSPSPYRLSTLAMYTDHFLPFVVRHFKLARIFGSIAFEFDTKSRKFVRIKCRIRVIAVQLQYISTFLYVGLLFYIVLDLPVLKMLQGFPILFCFALLLSVGSNVSVDIAPVQIINSILTFEKNLVDGIQISMTKFTLHKYKLI